jgi:hypothetical protein
MAGEYPNIAAMLKEVAHDADTTLGWCDDQFELEFAFDLLLDGLETPPDGINPRQLSRPTGRAGVSHFIS